MVGSRRLVGAVLGVLMCLNTACYTFVPLAASVAPQPGQQVRVRLTPSGTDAMASVLGPGVVAAAGTLVSQSADGITVGVTSVHLNVGADNHWAGQNVTTFPSRIVAGVDGRALDRGRTRIAAVVGAAAILGIFAIALSGTAGGGSSNVPPPPPPP